MPNLRQEPDGRMVVVETPAPEGWYTFGTGRADNPEAKPPESPNGTGKQIALSFDKAGEQKLDIALVQPIYLHNGQAYFRGSWGLGDEWSVGVKIPASTFGEGGDKNLVAVDLTQGVVAWKPVDAGKGSHHFDQAKACPVPARHDLQGAAFWNVDLATGDLLPCYGQPVGAFLLLNLEMESYFFKAIPVPGDGEFEAPTFQSEWISQRWGLFVRVTKATDGAGTMAAWLMTFRQDTR